MRNINNELAKIFPTQYKKPFDFSNVGFVGSLDVGGWTFEEDFTDDQTTLDARWTQAGTLTQPDASNDNFFWTGTKTSTNHAMSYSPATVNDTAFVLRLKLVLTNMTAGTYSSYFGFGMRSVDASVASQSGTPDSLMFFIKTRSASPTGNDYYLEGENGVPWGNPQPINNEYTNKPSAGQTRWFEMIRLTATTLTGNIFTDAYSSLLEAKSGVTISSSTIGVNNITFQNNDIGSADNNFNGTGDDIQFANGVTEAP